MPKREDIKNILLIGKHYMALNGFNRLTTIADFKNLFKEVQGALCLPAKKR
jgi:hypothetical protein